VRTFDELTLHLTLWDETEKIVVAHGVATLEDVGTWEAEAIVRIPDLDESAEGKKGFGVIDADDNVTLKFVADRVDW
jgi:hypothetical protein